MATTQQSSANLVVNGSISATPLQVSDQDGNPSDLYLSTAQVGMGGVPGGGPAALVVQGSRANEPLVHVFNTNTQGSANPEASITFSNASDGGTAWSAGVGGVSGPMKFFLWSINGEALHVDPSGDLVAAGSITARGGLTVDGTLTAGALEIDGGTATIGNLPSVTQAPQGAALAAVVVDTGTGKLYAL